MLKQKRTKRLLKKDALHKDVLRITGLSLGTFTHLGLRHFDPLNYIAYYELIGYAISFSALDSKLNIYRYEN